MRIMHCTRAEASVPVQVLPLLEPLQALQRQLSSNKALEQDAGYWLGMLSISGGIDRAAAIEAACAELEAQLPPPKGPWAASLFRHLYSAEPAQ